MLVNRTRLSIEDWWFPPLTPLTGIFLAHCFPEALGGLGKDGRICFVDGFYQLISSVCLAFHYFGKAAVGLVKVTHLGNLAEEGFF